MASTEIRFTPIEGGKVAHAYTLVKSGRIRTAVPNLVLLDDDPKRAQKLEQWYAKAMSPKRVLTLW